MKTEQLERLKRMAGNAGALIVNEAVPFASFDDESIARFAMAIAEDCAKRAENRGDKVSADVIRNIYREKA